MNTRWSSAFSDPQWIRIDLQEVYDLTGARIYWEASAAKSYEVQVSQNGSDWIRAYYTSGGDGGIDDISFQATARYVRMLLPFKNFPVREFHLGVRAVWHHQDRN
ncbi:MAG: discoidin domain-containing protein [Marinilabiliales bacterium]|nr:discoidin domain-containing protein [Marinilabiliales bacterium]